MDGFFPRPSRGGWMTDILSDETVLTHACLKRDLYQNFGRGPDAICPLWEGLAQNGTCEPGDERSHGTARVHIRMYFLHEFILGDHTGKENVRLPS